MNKPRDMRFEQLTSELHEAEQHVSEERLDRAIRLGLELGRKQRRKVRRRWQIGGTAASMLAACLAVIILYNHTVWPGSATTAAPDSSQALAITEQSASSNPSSYYYSMPLYIIGQFDSHADWREAETKGLFQPIDKSKEDGKFRITVDGILADTTKAVVFTSVDNTINNKKVAIKDLQITDSEGKILTYSGELNNSNSTTSPATSSVFIIDFNKSHQTPDLINIKATLHLVGSPTDQSKPLEIPIHIDRSKFDSLTQNLYANQVHQVGNVQFTMTKAVITPLSTKLYVSLDRNNAKKIKNFYNFQLYVGEGQKRREVRMPFNSIPSWEGDNTLVLTFNGSYFDYKDSPALSFTAAGIEQFLGYELQFTVDTKLQKLIDSPDSRMHFGNVTNTEDGTVVKLIFDETELPIPVAKQFYNEDDAIHYFKDGQGRKHSILDMQYRAYTADPTASIEFTIPKGNYTQPLTFTLQNYPGLKIKKDFTVNFHP